MTRLFCVFGGSNVTFLPPHDFLSSRNRKERKKVTLAIGWRQLERPKKSPPTPLEAWRAHGRRFHCLSLSLFFFCRDSRNSPPPFLPLVPWLETRTTALGPSAKCQSSELTVRAVSTAIVAACRSLARPPITSRTGKINGSWSGQSGMAG